MLRLLLDRTVVRTAKRFSNDFVSVTYGPIFRTQAAYSVMQRMIFVGTLKNCVFLYKICCYFIKIMDVSTPQTAQPHFTLPRSLNSITKGMSFQGTIWFLPWFSSSLEALSSIMKLKDCYWYFLSVGNLEVKCFWGLALIVTPVSLWESCQFTI